MKALMVIAGLVIGLFLGVAMLMLNPIALTQRTPIGLAGAVRTFSWETGGGYRGFALTPAGLLGAERVASGPLAFTDPGIRFARAEVVNLTGEAGAAPVLAVRLSAVARPNSLLRARLGIVTAWNIVWPGKGSVLLAGSENFWAPLRDGLWSAIRGRGFQPGEGRYSLPPVPALGPPALVGGSGEFAAARGAFREEFSAVADAPGDLVGLRQLHLAIE